MTDHPIPGPRRAGRRGRAVTGQQNEMAASLARDGFGPDEIAAMCTPTVSVADAPDPTPLRWGLHDVLWGDDDSVTVLLSGPDGEPYWLELAPERAAVLRQDLAGPPTDQTAETPREQLLAAIDGTRVPPLGYGTPEELLAAYDASRTTTDPAALRDRLRGMALSLATGSGPLVEPGAFDAALDDYRDAVAAAVLPVAVDRAALVRACASFVRDTDTAPAATCSAQYHGPGEDRARLCIRAAQHERTAHTDEHGFHWSDTVAMYPVADGTFRIGTDVRAELRRVADETVANGAQRLCGKTRGVSGLYYRPCARPAGHKEAYCKSADGGHLFLAAQPMDPVHILGIEADDQPAAGARQDEPWPVKEATRRYAEQLRTTPGQAARDGHTGWECDAGASLLVSASTPGPGALGTHHGTIYACGTHQDAAVERITGSGYEADPQPAPPGHRWNPWPCGHVTAHAAEALAALTAAGARQDGAQR